MRSIRVIDWCYRKDLFKAHVGRLAPTLDQANPRHIGCGRQDTRGRQSPTENPPYRKETTIDDFSLTTNSGVVDVLVHALIRLQRGEASCRNDHGCGEAQIWG